MLYKSLGFEIVDEEHAQQIGPCCGCLRPAMPGEVWHEVWEDGRPTNVSCAQCAASLPELESSAN